MTLDDNEVRVAIKCVNLAMANPGRFPIEYRAQIQALSDKLEGKKEPPKAVAAPTPAPEAIPLPPADPEAETPEEAAAAAAAATTEGVPQG